MHAHYTAVPDEDVEKYTKALNLAATLVQNLQDKYIRDCNDDLTEDDDIVNLKESLLELGYEIK